MRNVFLYFTILVFFLHINSVLGQNQQIIINQGKVIDNPFIQEYHQAYSLGNDTKKNDVRCIAVDHLGKIWAGTKTGLFILDQWSGKWKAMLDSADQGPVNDLFVDSKGVVWIATWNGLFKAENYSFEKINITDNPVAAISENEGKLMVIGTKSIWEMSGNTWIKKDMPYSRVVRKLITDKNDGYYLSTGKGLYHLTQPKARLFQNEKELLSDNVFGLAYSENNELWIGRLGGVTVYKNDERIKSYNPRRFTKFMGTMC